MKLYNNQILIIFIITLIIGIVWYFLVDKGMIGGIYLVLVLLLITYFYEYNVCKIDKGVISIKYPLFFRNKNIVLDENNYFLIDWIKAGRDSGVYLFVIKQNKKIKIKQWISKNEIIKLKKYCLENGCKLIDKT